MHLIADVAFVFMQIGFVPLAFVVVLYVAELIHGAIPHD